MAAPNLASSSITMYKKSAGAALTTTLTTSLLANASSSGKLLEITCAVIANIDGTNSVDVTLDLLKNAGTAYKLASAIALPAKSIITLDLKGINVEENDTVRGGASANGDAEITLYYNEYA